MKKFSVLALLSLFVLPASASADGVIPFEKIMNLMNGADITYERIGRYERPFKVIKKPSAWILRQMNNYEQSPIKDEGTIKYLLTTFRLIGQSTGHGHLKRMSTNAVSIIQMAAW